MECIITFDIAKKKFRISQNLLSTILKNWNDIFKEFFTNNSDNAQKRFRIAVNVDINEASFTGFKSVRNKNILINGPIQKEKAKHFDKLLKKLDFKPLNGWLQWFRDANVLK